MEAVLKAAVAQGLLLQGGRQRTDSTRVVADVRLLHRMEFAAESLGSALEALAAAAPDWLEQALAERDTDWLGRYGERVDSRHGPACRPRHETWLWRVGEDGFHLLTAVWRPDAPNRLRRIPALETLRRAWAQCSSTTATRQECGPARAMTCPGHQRLASPYDTRARCCTKRTTGWVGYCLHITETCDDDVPG
ncbi:hypothetical protein AB0I54_46825 [Streptomyces sp. NPDC050625]|uniref:hypothetical protein n=1 Tax=Streptomyces sp. NPDC050625 TaxID=3154629 RepID=UPI003439C69D